MGAAEKLELNTGRRGAMRCEPTQITWVDKRLVQWGEWSEENRGIAIGLGYGNNPLAGGVRSTASEGATAMPDGIYEIDRAVVRLPVDLHKVVIEHYRHPDCPESKRVERCGCSRATYFRRLAKAHVAVMMLLPKRKEQIDG